MAFLTALLLSFFSLFDDPYKMKWGNIDNTRLGETVYAADTSAVAVVLGDIGTVDYERDFRMIQKRHVRILILKQEGFDYGNIIVPFNNDQSIAKKAAQIFIKDASGKIVKTELKGKDFIVEKEDENWKNLRFTFPNMQPGCIIEYEVHVESQSGSNLRDWDFQREIPVEISSFTAEIPNYYVYKSLLAGDLPFAVLESIDSQRTYSFGSSTLRFSTVISRFVKVNVPALKSEPYSSSTKNYRNRITFALQAIFYDGETKPVQTSWTDLIERTQNDSDWKSSIVADSEIKKATLELVKSDTSLQQKARTIYNHLRKEYTWNEYYSQSSTQANRKTFKDKTGTSSDLNFLLIAMLNAVGVTADPVLISTRSNGFVTTASPFLRQFNHSIVQVELEGKTYLLDVLQKYGAFGLLTTQDYNKEGLRIKRAGGYEWIVIKEPETSQRKVLIDAVVSDKGTISGTIQLSDKGFIAATTRESISKADSLKELLSGLLFPDKSTIKIDSVTVKGLDNADVDLFAQVYFSSDSHVEKAGDVWFFSPNIVPLLETNPFIAEKRNLPIEFVAGVNFSSFIKITLPPNLVIEGLPENRLHALKTNGQYRRISQKAENVISLNEKFSYSKLTFQAHEYSELRKLFEAAVSAAHDPIALKIKP